MVVLKYMADFSFILVKLDFLLSIFLLFEVHFCMLCCWWVLWGVGVLDTVLFSPGGPWTFNPPASTY